MKALLILGALTLLATPGYAGDVAIGWSSNGRDVVVANGETNRITITDASSRESRASLPGLRNPRVVATGDGGRFAVLDPIANRLVFGTAEQHEARSVAETPVAAVWLDGSLFVVSRDAATLTRLADGAVASAVLPADPTLIRATGARLLVWSQTTGAMVEIDPSSLQRTRQGSVPPGASDLETDGVHAYLTYPREGQVIAFRLDDFAIAERLNVGAVPVDAALEGRVSAISPGRLSVADPSSKRIWRIEGTQTPLAAFGRAFLRSAIGLGFIRSDSAEAPTGVDRIWSTAGKRWAADSSSGALFRVKGSRLEIVAREVDPASVSLSPRGALAYWSRTGLQFSE